MTTFQQVLSRLLAGDPGRPLVTFYDDATGERTELSVTTYANWVAKVSSLLADELDIEHGSRLLVDLPPHWLGTVVLGAAWSCGLEVVWDGEPDAVVTGPEGLARWAGIAQRVPVVASALLPLAGRYADPVPEGVHDLGVEVWSQPDSFIAWPGPSDDDPAVGGTTQSELWSAAAAGSYLADGGRLLSEANPASPSGLASLTEPLARGGSLVLVAHASAERCARIAGDERVTARFAPVAGD
ncbi:MAG: TIGR03089 family protein [Nocardioides sp.]|nr:TIGR03089 family protein [Nocardioides sp.]